MLLKKADKTLTVLITILATTLLVSGCTNEAADPAAETGNWQAIPFTTSKTQRNPSAHDYFTTNASTQKITFSFDASTDYSSTDTFFNDIDGNTDAGEADTSENTKSEYVLFAPVSDDTIVGFKADVTIEQGNKFTVWGFEFLSYEDPATHKKARLTLLVQNKQYMLKYGYYDGSEWTFSTLQSWTSSSAIKDAGGINTVRAATRNDGKINIIINGTLVKTIMLPESAFNHGTVSAAGGIHHNDIQTDADPVEITYTFTEFQHP